MMKSHKTAKFISYMDLKENLKVKFDKPLTHTIALWRF